MVEEDDGNGVFDLGDAVPVRPVNLRVAEHPYPHLRDDDGCILARDYVDRRKMAYILAAVEKAHVGE